MKNLSIANLVLDIKTVEFEFPRYPEFKITLAHLSKAEEIKLREKSLVTKHDKESGFPYTEVDSELFLRNFAEKTVVGWKGLTYAVLAQMVLIDESKIEDLSEEVEFNLDNAIALLTNSKVFDNWVTQTLGKIDNFRN